MFPYENLGFERNRPGDCDCMQHAADSDDLDALLCLKTTLNVQSVIFVIFRGFFQRASLVGDMSCVDNQC